MQAKDLKNPPPVDQQQLNHFFNGGCLTTKTGLTASMKQLRWHHDFHQDEIFPRAYNISNPSDRQVVDRADSPHTMTSMICKAYNDICRLHNFLLCCISGMGNRLQVDCSRGHSTEGAD